METPQNPTDEGGEVVKQDLGHLENILLTALTRTESMTPEELILLLSRSTGDDSFEIASKLSKIISGLIAIGLLEEASREERSDKGSGDEVVIIRYRITDRGRGSLGAQSESNQNHRTIVAEMLRKARKPWNE